MKPDNNIDYSLLSPEEVNTIFSLLEQGNIQKAKETFDILTQKLRRQPIEEKQNLFERLGINLSDLNIGETISQDTPNAFLQSIDKLESIKTARYYGLKNHITTVGNFGNSKINVEPDTSKTGTLYNKLATLLRNNVQDQETLALYAMVLIGALSRKVSREGELIESKNNNSGPIRIGDYQEKILKPLLKFSNNKSLKINVSRDNDITYDIVDMNTRSGLLFDENGVLYGESALMNISGYPILGEQKRYYPSGALKQTFRLRESSGGVVRDGKSTFYYENGNQAYEFEYGGRYYPGGMYGKGYTSIGERIGEWRFYYENGTIACKSQFVDSAEKGPREYFDKEGKIINIEEPSRLIQGKEHLFDSNEFINKGFQFLRDQGVDMNIFE